MKLNKWIVLGGVMGCASMAAAATVPCASDPSKQCAELDIIVRDFQSTHPDFENFQEEAYNSIFKRKNFQTWKYPGYVDNLAWQNRRNQYDFWGCGNTQTSEYGIPVGTDGYPKQFSTMKGVTSTLPQYLVAKTSAAGYTWYGEYKDCHYDAAKNPSGLKVMRGYANELCTSEAETSTWTTSTKDNDKHCGGSVCNSHSWSQIVYVTPGMVAQNLVFDFSKGEDTMYEPVIVKNRPACDNEFFEQWFADFDVTTGNSLQAQGINARMNMTLQLPLVQGTNNTYEIDYNWNNGGYFPLDIVDANNDWVGMNTSGQCQFGEPCNFGPQSLSIFCPPYDYQWAPDQTDYMGDNTSALCNAWLANGGPKTPLAAMTAAGGSTMGKRHLRNYSLTMMGYAKFKYNKGAGEVFEFAGDDDMWIYVDGVLAVDLGGTHLAAPGKADMDFLAANAHGCHADQMNPLSSFTGAGENCDLDVDGSWKNGTWHHLHFFYADRQTDGSNMKIHSTLSELAKSRYGQPTVGKAVVKVDADGTIDNSLFLNTPLADSSRVNMIGANADLVAGAMATGDYSALYANGNPSIVVLRPDPITGTTVAYGFYVTSISEPTNKGADGFLYKFDGVMLDANGNPVSTGLLGGDAIAFNFPYDNDSSEDGRPEGIPQATWEQMVSWNKKTNHYVTATSGKNVEGFDPMEDWAKIDYTAVAVVKVVEDNARPDRPQFTNQAEQLTASAGSDGLANDMTGDLVITQIPAGVGDPMTWASDNAEQMMIHSGSAETIAGVNVDRTTYGFASSKGGDKNAQLCYSDGETFDDQSCVNFGFVTTQPFRINVRVFDHLGHFVSQYNKSMDRAEFEAALGANNSVSGCNGKPQVGSSGAFLVNLKMYPVAQSGRLLATGPYIYQVTIVKENYEYCYMSNGTSPTVMTMPYARTTEVSTKGYRRGKIKK